MDYWADYQLDFEEIRAKAKKIASRRFDSFDESILCIINMLSEYYKIPVFSKYFQNLTHEQLLMEYELLQYRGEAGKKLLLQAQVSDHQEEIDNLFKDWEAEDWGGGEDAVAEMAAKFMASGNFQTTEGEE